MYPARLNLYVITYCKLCQTPAILTATSGCSASVLPDCKKKTTSRLYSVILFAMTKLAVFGLIMA